MSQFIIYQGGIVNKQVLIAGGGGYIGTVLTRQLLDRGWRVKALDRFFFGLDPVAEFIENKNYQLVQADTRTVEGNIFNEIDAVLDLAALSNDPSGDLDPHLTQAINCEGRIRLANLAKKAGVKKYVLASSCSIYGHGTGQILNENSDPKPITTYAKANLMAEQGIFPLSTSDFSVTSLRQATVYGLSPRMRFDLVVNLMTLSAVQNGRILVMGGGKQWRPIIHVADTAEAFIKVLEAPSRIVEKQVFNVGSSEQNYQILGLAYLVREALPFHVEVEVTPDDADKRDYHVNFDKIKQVLDFAPKYKPEDGVKEIYEALKSGKTENTPRTVTVKWYKYLLEADRILKEIKLNGTLL